MKEMKFYPTSSFIKDALKKFLRALIFLGTKCCRSHAVRNRFRRLFKHAIRAWNYDAITSIIRANCQWRCFWEDLSFDANTNWVQLVKCKKHRHLCKMTRHRLCAVAIIYVSDASSWHGWTLFLVNKATKYRCPTYWISVFFGHSMACEHVVQLFFKRKKPESANSMLHCRTFQQGIWLEDSIFISRSEIVFRVYVDRENNEAQRMLVA